MGGAPFPVLTEFHCKSAVIETDRSKMTPMNCLKSVALLSSFLLASQSMGQAPQPIRNPGFGQAGNARPSAVYPAQYQQRVGKQVSTNQRRRARASNGGLAALPWVERFIKPKKEQPTVDYDKISVAGSQPPLSNVGRPTQPGPRATYGNIPRQPQPVVGQSPVASRQPRVQPESGGTGRFSARFSDADSSISGIYPQPTPNPVVPRINRSPEPSRGAVDPSPKSNTAVRQPTSSVESLPTPKANSERIARGEDKFLARLQEQSAPKVSRVPIKRTPIKQTSSADRETSQNVVSAEKSLPASESDTRVPQVLSNHGAKRSISDLEEVAKTEPVGEGTLVPEQTNLDVPAKLVAAPSVDDAAKKNANAKVNGQFITSQLQRPVQPSQPTPAETKTVRGNASAPDLPLPTAEASVSVPRTPVPTQRGSELPKVEEPKSASPLPTSAVPAISAPEQEAVTELKPTPPGTEEFSIPKNPLQPELPTATLPELPAGLPESTGSETPVPAKANDLPKLPELPKAKTDVESKLPSANSSPAVPDPILEELPNSQPEPLIQMPPKPAPLPEPGNPSTDAPPTEKLEPLPTPALPKPEIANLPAKIEAPEGLPTGSVALPRVQPPVNKSSIPPSKVEELEQKDVPESRPFGTLNNKSNAFGVAPEQRMNMQSPGVQVLVNGPETIAVATPSVYEIVAINRDTVDLNGLMLRLEVPAGVQVQATKNLFNIEKAPDGATLVTWGIEKLPAGEHAKASVNLTSRKDADFTIGLDWTLIPISRQAKVSVIAPALRVAIDGPQDVIYGKTNTYRVRILNEGKAAARDVKFQLSIPQMGTQQTDIGRIEPGKEEVLEYDLLFEQRGGTRLDAMASASNGLKAMGQTQVLVRRQDLQASLVAPELVYHGSAVNYRVNLSNRGDAMSKRTEAVVQLPEGTKPLGLPYSAKLDGNKLTWSVDPIAPSEGREYNFQLSLTSEGEHRVGFECKGDAGQAVSATATTVVQSIADLKLLVSDPTAPAPVGAEVTYELELINRGSKAANNVRVVAQFSKGVEPIRADGHQYRLVPGQVFFDPIASVGPGKKIKLRIFATADDAGIHRFRAEVKSEDEAIRLVQEESTQYLKTRTRVASPPASNSPLR